MARTLTATAIDAGTYPDIVVHRADEHGLVRASHVKGGWIELAWERNIAHRHSPQKIVTENRTIQVSKARALQAMANLAGMYSDHEHVGIV